MNGRRYFYIILAALLLTTAEGQPARGQFDPRRFQQQASKLKGQVTKQLKHVSKEDLEKVAAKTRQTLRDPRLKNARRVLGKLLKPNSSFTIDLSSDAKKKIEADYARLDAQASPTQKAQIDSLRARVKKSHWSFQVGVTSATGRDRAVLLGSLPQRPDPALVHRQAEARKSDRARQNIFLASRRARVSKASSIPHEDADGEPTKASQPTAANTCFSCAPNAATTPLGYPSSAFASPTAPAFSWRDRIQPVRDQQDCGSCWAFAGLGAVESAEVLYNGNFVDLSEQFAVNCAPLFPGSKSNCDGNLAARLADYLVGQGVPLETEMPYLSIPPKRNVTQRCVLPSGPSYKIRAWGFVSGDPDVQPSVDQIKEAIVAHGPVTARVYVDDDGLFYSLRNSVYDADLGDYGNHAIVIVGWRDDLKAWHVRNSWGEDWGEGGYGWVRYGVSHIGDDAVWYEPVIPPVEQTFSDRYVTVENGSNEDVIVHAYWEARSGSKFKWVPGDPGVGAQDKSFTLGPRKKVKLKSASSGKSYAIRAMRIWAESADKGRRWTTYKDTTLKVVSKPYSASTRGSKTIRIPAPNEPVPNPVDLYQWGLDAHLAEDFATAASNFDQYVDLFPDGDDILAVRYWRARNLWLAGDATAEYAYTEMIDLAPIDADYLADAHYDVGMLNVEEGYCGYATRSLEVVAYGELWSATPSMISSAKRWLKKLAKDDGKICANWE